MADNDNEIIDNGKITIGSYLNEKFPPIEKEEIEDFSEMSFAESQFARIEKNKKNNLSVQAKLRKLQAGKNKI